MARRKRERTAEETAATTTVESDLVVSEDPTAAFDEEESALVEVEEAPPSSTSDPDSEDASNAASDGDAPMAHDADNASSDDDAAAPDDTSRGADLTLAAAARPPDEDDPDDEEEDEDIFVEDESEDDDDIRVYDADTEDAQEEEALRQRAAEMRAAVAGEPLPPFEDDVAPGGGVRDIHELMSIVEALIFVSDEPLSAKTIADVLDEERGWVQMAIEELAREFNERNGGLMLRELAGGWQIATRPEHHEHIRAFLKSRPSAKLSLAALETLAVIAYKQPITVPEILEIRGVQSSSAIKTLLDKRLIVAKGRKETVGRPMMYGTSKEFLLQFGLRDLTELPSIEDFEDLAGGGA
ncbi:MAG TPA: SMC-Scp complex subunit ScpB [Pyrinomonadaceae bacterium]|jgi:segregation and condensation protein B